MKKTISGILTLLLCAVSVHTHAAIAVAFADENYSHTVYDASDVDSAKKQALEECQQNHSNCSVGISDPGPGAVAIAKGRDGGYGATFNKDPQKAYAKALASCQEGASGCAVVAMYWDQGISWASIDIITNKDGAILAAHLVGNAETKEIAEEDALESCKKKIANRSDLKCEIAFTNIGPTTLVYASGKTSSGYGWSNSEKAAKKFALDSCSGDRTCKVITVLSNSAPVAAPRSFIALAAKAQAEKKRRQQLAEAPAQIQKVNTRQLQNLSCTNECYNGSCIRTFSNGRKERWQAPRKYNPFTNNWEWDTTTNACGG